MQYLYMYIYINTCIDVCWLVPKGAFWPDMTNVASDFKISLKSTMDGKQKNLQNLKLSLSDTVEGKMFSND